MTNLNQKQKNQLTAVILIILTPTANLTSKVTEKYDIVKFILNPPLKGPISKHWFLNIAPTLYIPTPSPSSFNSQINQGGVGGDLKELNGNFSLIYHE